MVSNNMYISPIEFSDWKNWKNKIIKSNNEELKQIVEKDNIWYICALAVNKIDNERIFASISLNNSNSYICGLATSKIHNDELLKKLWKILKI